jgi:hypothetical protein
MGMADPKAQGHEATSTDTALSKGKVKVISMSVNLNILAAYQKTKVAKAIVKMTVMKYLVILVKKSLALFSDDEPEVVSLISKNSLPARVLSRGSVTLMIGDSSKLIT